MSKKDKKYYKILDIKIRRQAVNQTLLKEETGFDQSYISLFLNGKRTSPLESLKKIRDAIIKIHQSSIIFLTNEYNNSDLK